MLKLTLQTAVFLVLIFVSACSSTPKSQFYMLQVVDAGQRQPSDLQGLVLSLKVIRLPGYLDRPQIVHRDDSPKLKINEFQRWAEPLQEGFSRVLTENIAARISPGRIERHTQQIGDGFTHQLLVEILRFDSDQEQLVLTAKWHLKKVKTGQLIAGNTENLMVSITHKTIDDRVRAHSLAIAELADRIAEALGKEIQ